MITMRARPWKMGRANQGLSSAAPPQALFAARASSSFETVIDAANKACPCCQGLLNRIGEDVSEWLDIIPAQFRVLMVRRPKYGCRACEDVIVQTPAPARLTDGGLPMEATVAQVLVDKYADHLPLYRQSQIYAHQGITLDRSTLAGWVGRAAFHLRPPQERLLSSLKASFLLEMAQTRTEVTRPMTVAMVSGVTQATLNPV